MARNNQTTFHGRRLVQDLPVRQAAGEPDPLPATSRPGRRQLQERRLGRRPRNPLSGTADDQNQPWGSPIRAVQFPALYYVDGAELVSEDRWTPNAFSSHTPLANGGWLSTRTIPRPQKRSGATSSGPLEG